MKTEGPGSTVGPFAFENRLSLSSRQLALEWAVDNIRVNVLIPGTIDSPLFRKVARPKVLATFERSTPLGRLGLPSEMADLAVFLASPAASFITGQAINCCGGFSINTFGVPAGMTETLREARAHERKGRNIP